MASAPYVRVYTARLSKVASEEGKLRSVESRFSPQSILNRGDTDGTSRAEIAFRRILQGDRIGRLTLGIRLGLIVWMGAAPHFTFSTTMVARFWFGCW